MVVLGSWSVALDSWGASSSLRRVSPPEDLVEPSELSQLMTQRAIQCQLYYCGLTRDVTSGVYLRGATGVDVDYHGTDGLGRHGSRAVIGKMFGDADREVVLRNTLGWKARRDANPFVETRYVEYRVALRPAALAERLLESRTQIAAEAALDLDLLEDDSLAVDRERRRRLFRDSRREEETETACRTAMPPFDDSRRGDGAAGRASPLRAATYDLLKQLVTQRAVEALVAERQTLRSDDVDVLAAVWDHHKPHFVGSRLPTAATPADDLLIAFRSITPRFVGDAIVDPLAILDDILDRRKRLAKDWQASLASVPEEHLRWRKWHLSNIFAKSLGTSDHHSS